MTQNIPYEEQKNISKTRHKIPQWQCNSNACSKQYIKNQKMLNRIYKKHALRLTENPRNGQHFRYCGESQETLEITNTSTAKGKHTPDTAILPESIQNKQIVKYGKS